MGVKRPNSKRNLDMAIRRLGTTDEDYVANRTLVANAIAGSLLPGGAVKGGTAMTIRFGSANSRSSNDLDAARNLGLELFLEEYAESLREGWEGFTGTLIARKPAHPKSVPTEYIMQPFDIKLSYLGSSWCTVELELGHNELGDASHPDMIAPIDANRILVAVGFPVLGPVPTMPLHHQIAQKLHAASGPNSERAHDLIDLQVLLLQGDTLDWHLLRETCVRLFEYRRAQEWPPVIQKHEGWDELYAAQTIQDKTLATVDEAIEWANRFIARIDATPHNC